MNLFGLAKELAKHAYGVSADHGTELKTESFLWLKTYKKAGFGVETGFWMLKLT